MKIDHEGHRHVVQSTVKAGRHFYRPASVIALRPRLMTNLAWGLCCVLALLLIVAVW